MLKKRWILFLGFVVFVASSACVTPTHASSATSVVITHVQTADVTGAKMEYIGLYNNGPVEVSIGNWCLTNKTQAKFACISQDVDELVVLPAYSSALIASSDYIKASGLADDAFTQSYSVTNQSSGSLVGSSDMVSLYNEDDELVDQHSWTSNFGVGKVAQRIVLLESPRIYAASGSVSDWAVGAAIELPQNQAQYIEIEPEQPTEEPLKDPYITELLPNPTGADTGNEYIELYNPNEAELTLASYSLRVGPNLDRTSLFPEGASIAAKSYRAFTNTEIKFTLLNSASTVGLFKNDVRLGELVTYNDPKEGQSWSYFEEVGWLYTAILTPSLSNSLGPTEQLEEQKETPAVTVKPCAANQYRSSETNRCRLLNSAAVASVAACKVGQIRNPQTNRCRNITQAAPQTPCKEGQERSIETGRCRTIKQMPDAGYGVDEKEIRSAEQGVAWYYWAAIGAIIVCILVYGAWEWREEMRQGVGLVKRKFARRTE